jgi:hypothetical protein
LCEARLSTRPACHQRGDEMLGEFPKVGKSVPSRDMRSALASQRACVQLPCCVKLLNVRIHVASHAGDESFTHTIHDVTNSSSRLHHAKGLICLHHWRLESGALESISGLEPRLRDWAYRKSQAPGHRFVRRRCHPSRARFGRPTMQQVCITVTHSLNID